MTTETSNVHPLRYDGKISELYKIYALSISLSILTLGIYHFWGKTRKRRYITSSFILENDRFEYTGYAKELLIGLMIGLTFVAICSLPLFWAQNEIESYARNPTKLQQDEQAQADTDEKSEVHHFEQHDAFNQNKLIADFVSISQFVVQFNDQGLYYKYHKGIIDIKWRLDFGAFNSNLDAQFNPKKNLSLLFAIILTPLYLVFFFVCLPFVIVFGSLRYRVSRLRWRGIRGHLEGSAVLYSLLGVVHTILKVVTLGFWIPISDIMLNKYKLKKLFFGNQQASFSISYKNLIMVNLATIGATIYVVCLMMLIGFFVLPYIAQSAPQEGWLIEKLVYTLIKEGYFLCLLILIWICYIPRYWYRATLLRGRYNNLKFGDIGFTCNVSGYEYLKLFVINDLIFICTLSLGVPLIWQRRMQFFCRHVQITGDLNQLSIEQAPGEKTKFGGGFASVMNLEIGLI